MCVVYCYRKKQIEEDPDWKMTLPRSSRSNSRSSLRHIHGDNDDTDTLKKSRSYDKVYRTHEPLEGKPTIEFPEKKWDLDDEDITSSEGSELVRDTKRANDIEYINSNKNDGGDPVTPRQFGRRSERLGNTPIEEEEDDDQRGSYLPPPPNESPSPRYSPSFSGLDRNSSFMTTPPPQQQQQPTLQYPMQPMSMQQPNYQTRPPSGIRVLPLNNASFYSPGPSSPTSPVPLEQDVGLPRTQNTKSTEV